LNGHGYDMFPKEIGGIQHIYEDDEEWTINFEEAVPTYNQFLLTTGDREKWLMVTRNTIHREYEPYEEDRNILASSEFPYHDYYAGWFGGYDNEAYPYVSLRTPVDPYGAHELGLGVCLYKGNGTKDELGFLEKYNGANVYIRKYDYDSTVITTSLSK